MTKTSVIISKNKLSFIMKKKDRQNVHSSNNLESQ